MWTAPAGTIEICKKSDLMSLWKQVVVSCAKVITTLSGTYAWIPLPSLRDVIHPTHAPN